LASAFQRLASSYSLSGGYWDFALTWEQHPELQVKELGPSSFFISESLVKNRYFHIRYYDFDGQDTHLDWHTGDLQGQA
jgi:hypothetical protein